jgi:hypothetical protein
VTKTRKVTACQGVFKRSLSVMETYAINGVLNVGVEKKNSNAATMLTYHSNEKKNNFIK